MKARRVVSVFDICNKEMEIIKQLLFKIHSNCLPNFEVRIGALELISSSLNLILNQQYFYDISKSIISNTNISNTNKNLIT